MRTGDFVARHVDRESNPDYCVTLVLYLEEPRAGGRLLLETPAGVVWIPPEAGRALIHHSMIPHSIERGDLGRASDHGLFLCRYESAKPGGTI